jgi:hypothetical protein
MRRLVAFPGGSPGKCAQPSWRRRPFRPDYRRWIGLPVFDEVGFPLAPDGFAAGHPGLYFCGVHFLRTRKSSLIFGVGEDAAIIAAAVARRLGGRSGGEMVGGPGLEPG